MVFIIEEKVRAYSVFKVEKIILPTDLKGDFAKKNRYTIAESKVNMRLCGRAEYICFSQDVNFKVALSGLQFNIIELVLVA